MPNAPLASQLAQYMQNYGVRLQALTGSTLDQPTAGPASALAANTPNLGEQERQRAQQQIASTEAYAQEQADKEAQKKGGGGGMPQIPGMGGSGGMPSIPGMPSGQAPGGEKTGTVTIDDSGNPAAGQGPVDPGMSMPTPQSKMDTGAAPGMGGASSALPKHEGGHSDEGLTFEKYFDDQPKAKQDEALDHLSQTLKAGNQTIDSAYDDVIAKMGSRPDPNRKLTRKEKGRIIMEFGLSMIQASRDSDFGGSLAGGAQGAAEAYVGSVDAREQEARNYDSQLKAINIERARAKSKLATEGAVADVKDRNSPDSSGNTKGILTGDDGTMYMYTNDGQIKPMLDPNTHKPIKGKEALRSGKTFESEWKYNQYLDTYGKDAYGNDLTGKDLEAVKRQALKFATKGEGKSYSDLELQVLADTGADSFMRANADAYRDMDPAEAKKQRDAIAKERFDKLKQLQQDAQDVEFDTSPTAPPADTGRRPRAAPGPRSALEAPGPAPAQSAITPAPAGAIQKLRQHPELREAFKRKYGYLPPGL